MILKNIYLENPEEEMILKNVYFLSERIMVFNAQELDFRIFRQWKILSWSRKFLAKFSLDSHGVLGWRAMKSDRLIGSFFFNVMHLSLVQTVLYKQHYNAMKLTFACLAAIFGGETAAFGLSTKIKSILQPKFFLIYLFKNIFVLYRYAWKRQPLCLNCCWGLPIPKKTRFLGP